MINWIRNRWKQHQITKLLTKLGSNSREVANSLLYMKVYGKKHSGGCCPIATFLRSQGFDVVIGSDRFVFQDEYNGTVMPDACTQFVLDFDGGAYPFLINELNVYLAPLKEKKS